MNILDEYCKEYPSVMNSINIFSGQWSSALPGYNEGGVAELFADPRLIDAIELCGGLDGKKCLELGPLEGGHTYIMHKSGASHITSIEANQRAYIKCLISKALLKFNADFLLGDFMQYITTTRKKFDFTNMSGVLYHITEPYNLIKHVARISDQVACWTHYMDAEILKTHTHKFDLDPKIINVDSLNIHLYKQRYLEALQIEGYCGGKEEISYWLSKNDIIKLFNFYGFDVTILSEDINHPNGPCFNFVAIRNGKKNKKEKK